jgi:hypothetical protein
VVAAQTRQIEIQPLGLGQPQEIGQPCQRSFIGLLGGLHKAGHLQMDPHDVGAQRLHLAEVLDDAVPLAVPVVLQQRADLVVVVVEAPRHKRLAAGFEDEQFAVGSDLYEGHLFGLKRGGANEGRDNAGQNAAPGPECRRDQ